jgi:ABC-type multidrug transport system fused ATPase/permease subunit
VRVHPLPDPGTPDARSPGRLLWWIARQQIGTILAAMLFGSLWMLAQAVTPAVVGRAIDSGVTEKDTSALVGWSLTLLGVGLCGALAGVMRHRFAVSNWLTAAYRVQQLTVRKAVQLGASLPARVASGEVVSIGSTDIQYFGGVMDVTGRVTGAVVTFVVVAIILLSTSVPLGLVVLVGVPILLLAVSPIIKPLHARQSEQREQVGELTTLASDIVTGLRVLRGIGGEETFGRRYRRDSQQVREAGVRVARVQSMLDASGVLLPGIFVVLVTWLGARYAIQGRISPGDLVAFYGYAAFLVTPLRTLTEGAQKYTRGFVAAKRMIRVLQLEPDLPEPTRPAAEPRAGAELVDAASGLVVRPGLVTAVVSARPTESAALADRLGRHVDTTPEAPVTFGGVPLEHLPLATVRRRILVNDVDARLFSGRLRDELDPTGAADDARIAAALEAASATDVVEGLPDGLQERVEERGRSFSGGQRQRLVLTRALVADPEVLVLVEPTSAVDAHTEDRIAARLRDARAGRTTVVMTASPLVLDRADRVAFLVDGRVVAEGTHDELLTAVPAYRSTVTREEDA